MKLVVMDSQSRRSSTGRARFKLPISTILHNTIAVNHLRAFASAEHSEENLLFWQAAEEMRHAKTRSEMEKKCKHIWNMFLKPTAELQLTLEHEVIDQLKQDMEAGHFDRFMFNDAQSTVQKVLRQDIHVRFMGSEAHQLMCLRLAQKLYPAVQERKALPFLSLVDNPLGQEEFRKYLAENNQDDSLHLYVILKIFKIRPMSEDERNREAMYIHRRFVVEAKQPIDFVDEYEQKTLPEACQNADPRTFDRLFRSLEKHLHTWYFEHFVKSPSYEGMVSQLEEMYAEAAKGIKPLSDIQRPVTYLRDRDVDKWGVPKRKPERKLVSQDSLSKLSGSEESKVSRLAVSVQKLSLETILGDWELLHGFYVFAKKEHSEENVMFCMDVQKFRGLPKDKRMQKARFIFKNYFKRHAQYELPVGADILEAIRQRLLENRPDRIDGVFDSALDFVLRTIRTDSYPRYLQSRTYRVIMSRRQQEKKSKRSPSRCGCM